MIDTGEELDIVYTTYSLIVTTLSNGYTSMVITRQESKLPCAQPSSILPDLHIVTKVSGPTVITHGIHITVGKLLVLYNPDRMNSFQGRIVIILKE